MIRLDTLKLIENNKGLVFHERYINDKLCIVKSSAGSLFILNIVGQEHSIENEAGQTFPYLGEPKRNLS